MRRTRGLVVAAVGVGLPVLGHLAGGGTLDVAPSALFALTLVAALCVTASARAWTTGRLTVALAGIAVLVHGTLWLGHEPHVGSWPTAAGHHLASTTAAASGAPLPSHSMGASLPMLLAHLAALVLAIALLRRGETLLLWLWSVARRVLVGLLVPPTRPSTTSARVTAGLVLTPDSCCLVSGGPRAPPHLASP
jgi:hypothetical protein